MWTLWKCTASSSILIYRVCKPINYCKMVVTCTLCGICTWGSGSIYELL